MADDGNIVVKVVGRGFEKLQAQMAKQAAATQALETKTNQAAKSMNRLSGSMSAHNKQTKNLVKTTTNLQDRFDALSKTMKKTSSVGRGFSKVFRAIFFLVIGLAIEFAVVAASLMSVNAAFAIGNGLVKAYNYSMAATAGIVAGVGAALAVAAAAQREYTAAQFAHTQKATPQFGSAMAYSQMAIRNLTSDTELAIFGIQELNAAFAAVSRNSQFTGKSQEVLRALRDFASIGGDPGKNLTAIGEFVGLLQKEGRVTSKVSTAAQGVGEEFDKAFKKIAKGGGSVQEVFASIISGDMSKAAGITGQADLLTNTLFGSFKKFSTLLIGLFADIGTPLLEPARKALTEIFNIIRNGLLRIAPDLEAFGKGTFLDSIVAATRAITDFTVLLFEKYLPKSEGMIKGIIKTYYSTKESLTVLTRVLDKLRDGGTIVIQMFGKPLKQLFASIGDNIEDFSNLAVEKKDDFLEFGDRLAGLVDAAMDFAQAFKRAFAEALPTINRVVDALTKMVQAITALMNAVSGIPGVGGELIAGIAGYGLIQGTRGAQYRHRRGGGGGKKGKGAMFGHMGDAMVGLMGLGMIGGQGHLMTDDTGTIMRHPRKPGEKIGKPITGSQYNRMQSTGRLMTGRVSSRLFTDKTGNLRNIGLLNTMGAVGGFLNPSDSMSNARRDYLLLNDAMDDSDPNKKKGMRRRLGGAKAGLAGGFSMGGMVAGMGMAALANSGMAPQMMQQNAGAIEMGGLLMAINPALGIGAMGAGTLFNLAKGTGANTKAGGIGTGMAGGAALGGAIGTMFGGPVGTAIGAGIGALVGGVVGYIGGDKAERGIAKEAAKSLSYEKLGKATASMITGDGAKAKGILGSMVKEAQNYQKMDDAGRHAFIRDLERQGVITASQREQAVSHDTTFGKELLKNAEDMQKAAEGPLKQFDLVMNGLQGATGKTKDEILDLANKMGVNLYDPTLKLGEAIEGLGLKMELTAQSLARSGTDALISSLSVMDEITQARAQENAYKQSIRGIRQAGGGTESQYVDALTQSVSRLATQYGDDPLAQLYGLQGMFGEGGTLFRQGGSLEGLRGNFTSSGGEEMYNQLVGRQAQNLATNRSQALSQLVTQGGFEFKDGAGTFQSIQSQLQAMYKDPTQRAKAEELEALLSSGAGLGSTGTEMSATLAKYGVTVGADAFQVSTAGTLQQQLTETQKEMQSQIISAVATGFDEKPEWWETTPEWWSKDAIKEALQDDTSTPRAGRVGDTLTSRLGRTMSRHNYMDGQLTGKRTVTSSFRTVGLGSINSDHVTGNAYDLTGQNLGQYQTMVNKAGGFAEFHGVASNRHLHVVPPQTPMGDSGTSRIGSLASAPRANDSTPSSGGAVTINVYANENQSERAIAKIVMDEISKAQRNYRERR